MKKFYTGIAVLAILILASGIYAVNYDAIDVITTISSSVSDDVVSEVDSDVSQVGSDASKKSY